MVNHLIANAVLNISSDLLIMAIPAPLVFKVKIPLRNKLILAGMFFVGFFTVCIHFMCMLHILFRIGVCVISNTCYMHGLP